MRRALSRHVIVLVWVLPALALRPGAAQAADDHSLCSRAASRSERLLGLPANLLVAMAEVESGRWPWAVRAGGVAYMAPSRPAAVALVRALRELGVRDVTVGCLQINLRFHGAAFDGIEEALEPAANADYAGRLLRKLHHGASWWKAVGRYQGGGPAARRAYIAKVAAAWSSASGRAPPAAAAPAPPFIDTAFHPLPEGVLDLSAFPDLGFRTGSPPARAALPGVF